MTQQTEKEIKLAVKTVIDIGEDQETFEFETFGQYYKKRDTIYLKYNEKIEEGTIQTIVKMANNEVVIMRSGAVKMRMAFQLGEDIQGTYETMYGALPISTLTKELSNQSMDSNNDGQLKLNYELMMQGSLAGTYIMTISYKEER